MKMRIGMILEEIFPSPNPRVEQEAETLSQNGHEIYILTIKRGTQSVEENVHGIHVKRFLMERKKNIIVSTFYQIIFYLRGWDWEKRKVIEYFTRKYNIEVLHVHDLPLVKTALIVGDKFGVPVIADLHENFPEAIKVWSRHHPLEEKLLYNIWRRYEKTVLPRVKHIIVVVEEMKKRIKQYGLLNENITVVSNTKSVTFYKDYRLNYDVMEKYKDKFVVSFIGGAAPHRGLDTAIEAMKYAKEKIRELKFLIVGWGKDKYITNLKKQVKKLHLEDTVEFIGTQPRNELPTYYNLTQIGLIPFHVSPQTNASAPHKIFEFMIFKIPVIVSNCVSLIRIVHQSNAGLVFEDGKPESMAQQLIHLYFNKPLRQTMGFNGYKAATYGPFSWEKDAERLNQIYECFK